MCVSCGPPRCPLGALLKGLGGLSGRLETILGALALGPSRKPPGPSGERLRALRKPLEGPQ
eukprot:7398830-Pyramimonas_sp.AAC.1